MIVLNPRKHRIYRTLSYFGLSNINAYTLQSVTDVINETCLELYQTKSDLNIKDIICKHSYTQEGTTSFYCFCFSASYICHKLWICNVQHQPGKRMSPIGDRGRVGNYALFVLQYCYVFHCIFSYAKGLQQQMISRQKLETTMAGFRDYDWTYTYQD